MKDDGLLTHLEQSSLWTFVRRNPTAELAQVRMKAVLSIADGGSMLLDVLYAISLAIGLALTPVMHLLWTSWLDPFLYRSALRSVSERHSWSHIEASSWVP